MTRALNLPPFEANDPDTNPTLNVLIAYEDFEAGKRAKETYDFLVANVAHDYQFSNQMWKFEVLSIPKLGEIAAQDAALADIVIISCQGHDLPAETKAWLELWLGQRIRAIALVALFAQPNLVGAAKVRSYLAGVALRGQMEFFAQPDESPGQPKPRAFVASLRKGTLAEQTFPMLTTAVEHDSSFPRWGINE